MYSLMLHSQPLVMYFVLGLNKMGSLMLEEIFCTENEEVHKLSFMINIFVLNLEDDAEKKAKECFIDFGCQPCFTCISMFDKQ